jgi:hypothetical protein
VVGQFEKLEEREPGDWLVGQVNGQEREGCDRFLARTKWCWRRGWKKTYHAGGEAEKKRSA